MAPAKPAACAMPDGCPRLSWRGACAAGAKRTACPSRRRGIAHHVRTRCFAKAAIGIICAIALLAFSGVALHALWINGAFLPSWVSWKTRYVSADLDGDHSFESVTLKGRRLSVGDHSDDGAYVEASLPEDWLISDALVSDIDHDGMQEVIALTWKRGSFGSSKPFWVEHDDWDFSEHVFIFRYRDGKLEHHWLSSDVRIPIAGMSADSYSRLHLLDDQGGEKICEWQSWGLSFIDDDNPSYREAQYDATTVAAAGDVIPHTCVQREDADALLRQVSPLLGCHDLRIVNLEAPLVEDSSRASGVFPRFAAPYAFGDALMQGGFNVICLANNHIADAGEEGIASTLAYYEEKESAVAVGVTSKEGGSHTSKSAEGAYRDAVGFPSGDSADSGGDEAVSGDCGIGDVAYLESNGVRVALINSTFGINDGTDPGRFQISMIGEGASIAERLRSAEESADISICYLHVGEEYGETPDAQLQELARELAEAGADIILCSHSHIAQRAELITTGNGNSAYVVYGLGNFVANQPYPQTVLGLVASFTVEKAKKPFWRASNEGPLKSDASEEPAGDMCNARSIHRAHVVDFRIIPTVCHFADGRTSVMLLEDYTEDLAQRHHINSIEAGSVSLDALENQFLSLAY